MKRGMILVFCLFSVAVLIPLWIISIPPLVDYPNHLARIHLLTHESEYYAPRWAFLPNLAMDVIAVPLSWALPIEQSGRLFLSVTLLLLPLGTVLLSAALNRSVTAWPLVAFCFVYNRVFLWGFVNYLFGLGLALIGLALWIRWRSGSLAKLAISAQVMGFAVFLSHLVAFGVYGASLLTYEAIMALRRRGYRPVVGSIAVGHLVLPILIFFFSSDARLGAASMSFGGPWPKLIALSGVTRSYSVWIDVVVAGSVLVVVAVAWKRQAVTIERTGLGVVLVLGLIFLVSPRYIFNSELNRLGVTLLFVSIAVLHIEWRSRGCTALMAGSLAVLVILRVVDVGVTWRSVMPERQSFLAVLDDVPRGAKLFTAIMYDSAWQPLPIAIDQLNAMAVERRNVFVPTLFTYPATPQPLVLRPPYRAVYRGGPAFADRAVPPWDKILREYDFVLLVRGELLPSLPARLGSVRKSGEAVLYRVAAE